MKIKVENFKKINEAEVELDEITVFVGGNNAGKSSFIQAIQFAVSAAQTLELNNVNWIKQNRSSAFNSDDFLYSPTKEVETLHHNSRLTQNSLIQITFRDGLDESAVRFARGKNKGIQTKLQNRPLGNQLCSIINPFCVYVPGIAGIPLHEKYEPELTVKKSAVRGDSNDYLRNILLRIKNKQEDNRWGEFLESVRNIYPKVEISITYDEKIDEYIQCYVGTDGRRLSLDSVGTGVLQVIQIFAYAMYFFPKILLLDEPDSHLHPSKQKALAKELQRKSDEYEDMKVVFSTHSMHLLRALNDAKTYHFIEGKPEISTNEASVLLDIGALDADYIFAKPNLKYVIVTEDRVDNVKAKYDFIRKFVVAHGVHENEFELHSYEGCKNIFAAKALQGLVKKHLPQARVIVHIDRDQRWEDEDPYFLGILDSSSKHSIPVFITDFSEIENYFCQPAHLQAIYGKTEEETTEIYNQALDEVEALTRTKLADFLINEKPALVKDGQNNIRTHLVNTQVQELIENYYEMLVPGKEVLARIKNSLNAQGGQQHNLVQPSVGLVTPKFQAILAQLEAEGTENEAHLA